MTEHSESEEMPLIDILKKLAAVQATKPKMIFKIRRYNAWQDFSNYLKKTWINPSCNLKVQFIGEPSEDTGGPRRELFTSMLYICV